MAVLEQERHVELVSGAAEAFVITSLMVSAVIPAQLPHLNVFVIAVNDVTDPKQDTLARIAMIADLSTLPIGRDPGIAAPGPNGIEFLSASVTNSYDTLETGNDAAQAIRDRVNALITDWITFRTTFNAPDPTPALYTFPSTDASQSTALINAYAIAKQDRYAKQTAKATSDAALVATQADYTYKSGLIPSFAAQTVVVQGYLTTVISQFGTLLVAANVFLSANLAGTGVSAFNAAVTQATIQQSAMAGYTTAAAALVTSVQSYTNARASDQATAATALTAAQSDQITKTQQLASAQTLEAAALAAVLAVCPDFDKTSIPLVPDV